MITLRGIAKACGPAYGVERLASNVYAVTDFSHTITINGGQLEVDTADDTAELLITDTWTGAERFTGEIRRTDEVPTILATIR